jgi:hypothetical protein
MFVVGELLDVDAPCGGYNLHWAWASGLLAGAAAAQAVGGLASNATSAADAVDVADASQSRRVGMVDASQIKGVNTRGNA